MAKSSILKTDIQSLFFKIFSYHFKRKPLVSKRTTFSGSYTSMLFCKATSSPLLRLIAEELIGEFEAVEILIKDGYNQEINDSDLESVIFHIREKNDTLFILVSFGNVPSDDFERLFRLFVRNQVVILPLGRNDILKLEDFVEKGNINACLVIFAMLADRITSKDDNMPNIWLNRAKWQKEAILSRLEIMDKLECSQLRTLVKKLRFLMSFEKSGGEVAKTCAMVNISRKIFYLWCEKDLVFKKLVYMD
jgi:hypothetical protein